MAFMSDILTIEKFLGEELGLSPKEVTLYLNLVRYGSKTILELSELSNINRATTHVNIECLSRKGLVAQMKKGRGSRRLVMAEPVEKLAIIFKERKAKLEAAENQLGNIVRELMGLKKQADAPSERTMEIRRYEGKDEVRLIYDDILKAKEIRAYLNYDQIFELFPSNVGKFLKAHKKSRYMQIWEIMDDCKLARDYARQMPPERYHCRLTPKKLNLVSMDYLLFDGKAAIIDITGGITGVVIENETFYENSKAIYEFVWRSLPPYNG
jgi:sugar-specific transcriptional regulator TrmB